jgi:hypothetical protein
MKYTGELNLVHGDCEAKEKQCPIQALSGLSYTMKTISGIPEEI